MSISAMQLVGDVSIQGAGQAIGDLAAVGNAGGNADAILQKLAIGATIAAGAALVGFGAKAVDMAGNFQASMGKVEAYVGLTKEQTDSLSNSILNLASAMGQSPQAMADALYPIMSSGYDVAQSLDILTLSAKTAAASGADMAVIADALTTSLKAMHAPASQAGAYMDDINKIVSLGKGQVSDYAAVIGKLSLAAGSAHVPFADMGAALADLTTHGFPSVAQASTALGNLFTQIGPKVDSMAQHAKSLGIAFDENKFKTMDLADKMAYLEQVTGGNQGELLKLLGGNTLALKSFNALEGSVGDFTGNLKAMAGATGTTGEVFQKTYGNWNNAIGRLNATFQVLMIKVGQQLLPMLTSLVEYVTPMVAAFTNWAMSGHAVADMLDWFNHNLQLAIPIVAGLAAMLFATLVPAVWSLAAGVIAATWPILAIGAAVALVAAGAVYLYQNFQFVRDGVAAIGHAFQAAGAFISAGFAPAMQRIGDFFTTTLAPAMQQFGNFVRSQFTPVWENLVQMWQSKLMPLFQQIWAAVQKMIPLFELIGVVIGAIVVVAFGLLVGMIKGLVQAISGLLTGLIIVIGGIVQMFTGAFQVIGGIIGFFVDLFTGHFDKLGSDLAMIGQGIINIFLGMWNIVAGIFLAAWYTISGYVSGFISGIIDFFTTLWDALVGHSIIPDMIMGILQWFSNLVAQGQAFFTNLVTGILTRMVQMEIRVLATITEMVTIFLSWLDNMTGGAVTKARNVVSGITDQLSQLSSLALKWGQDMMSNLVAGIQGGLANVGHAAQNVAGTISSWLHFSKPDIGPLATADQWMPDFTSMMSEQIVAGVPKIQSAVAHLAMPFTMLAPHGQFGGSFASAGFSPSLPAAAGGGAGGGPGSPIQIIIQLDGRDMADFMVDPLMNKVMRTSLRKSGIKRL